jgi:hypothetical protein
MDGAVKPLYLKSAYALLLFWFCWIGREVVLLQAWAGPLLFSVFLLAVINPRRIAFRAAAFAAAAYAHHVVFSAGLTGHSHHAWPLAAGALVFVSGAGARFTENDLRAVRCGQALLLAPYFLSGLWRLHSALQPEAPAGFFEMFLQFPQESLAYALAEGNGPPDRIVQFIIQWPVAAAIGIAAIWIFELTSIVPVLKPKLTRWWGLAAVAFHFSTGMMLSVWFYPMILSSLFFLFLTEEFLERDKASD